MWPELGAEWELSDTQYAQIERREGRVCSFCWSNERVRLLARTLLEDIREAHGSRGRSVAELTSKPEKLNIRIAEINAVAHLHPFLARLPGLSYSEYRSSDQAVRDENLMELTYNDKAFDYVLTSDTLEHVPDFDRALGEIRRVLKPGGKHIFTIPVIWDRPTRQRASFTDAGVKHFLPPSYHAGPQPNRSDYLVVNEFGGDVMDRVAKAGFAVDVVRDRNNPLISVIFAARRNGTSE
jgi:SAM-dependent methyltransferase